MTIVNQINDYINRNFYPFIITALLHIGVILFFVTAHFSIYSKPSYQIVMQLDAQAIEDMLKEEKEKIEEKKSAQQLQEGEFIGNNASNDEESSSFSHFTSQNNYSGPNQNANQDKKTAIPTTWHYKDAPIVSDVDQNGGNADEAVNNNTYTGSSNIKYHVTGRHALKQYTPVYKCKGGGLVYVDIEVNPSGNVVKATINEEKSEVNNSCLFNAAKVAAYKFLFSEGTSSNGYISFMMQKQ